MTGGKSNRLMRLIHLPWPAPSQHKQHAARRGNELCTTPPRPPCLHDPPVEKGTCDMFRSVLVPTTPLCRLPSLPPFPSALSSLVPSSSFPLCSSIFTAFFLLSLPSLLPFSSSLMSSVSSASFFFRLFFLLSRLVCCLPSLLPPFSSSVSSSSFLFFFVVFHVFFFLSLQSLLSSVSSLSFLFFSHAVLCVLFLRSLL